MLFFSYTRGFAKWNEEGLLCGDRGPRGVRCLHILYPSPLDGWRREHGVWR